MIFQAQYAAGCVNVVIHGFKINWLFKPTKTKLF